MTDAGALVTPPTHPVHRKPLPAWRLLRATLTNPLTAFSEESFTFESGRVLMFGLSTIGVNHPDGVKQIARLTRFFLEGPGRPRVSDVLARSESAFAFLAGPRRRFQAEWHRAIDAFIRARQDTGGGPRGRDLLDILLAARDPESGAALAADEVRDQTATMLFAGFETTARLLSWAAYLLALDQREQAAVREELAAFPPEQVAGLQDLKNWPRLKCALLEALRLPCPSWCARPWSRTRCSANGSSRGTSSGFPHGRFTVTATIGTVRTPFCRRASKGRRSHGRTAPSFPFIPPFSVPRRRCSKAITPSGCSTIRW
jgi:hypothetical protein